MDQRFVCRSMLETQGANMKQKFLDRSTGKTWSHGVCSREQTLWGTVLHGLLS